MRFTLRLNVSLLALLLCSACENEVDTTPNVLPMPVMEAGSVAGTGDMGNEEGGAETGGSEESGCASCVEVGTWYRFDLLKLNSLDGGSHPVVGVLNSLWRSEVDDHIINVLFEVREVEGDRIIMGAMNAAWLSEAEDDYCVLPSTAIEFNFAREGCDISNQDPAGINIYAGSQEIPKNCSPDGGDAKHAIPVRSVLLGGSFDTECQRIDEGLVRSAAIKRSSLEQTCTCLNTLEACVGLDDAYPGDDRFGECAGCNTNYSSLARQLTTFQALNWDCEVDGEEAVCIEASFSAQRLDFTPPVCP